MTLAQQQPFSGGLLGLLVVVLLAIATVLLIRNMTARLKRLPRQYDDGQGENTRGGPPQAPQG